MWSRHCRVLKSLANKTHRRAKRDCYSDCCDSDEYPDLVGQWLSNNDHRHCHCHTLGEHDSQHEHQDKLEFQFDYYERVLHNSHLDVNDFNGDVFWSRSPRPPNLDEHPDHTPRLLSNWLLRLFGRVRWRLLPNRSRLPGDILPIDSIDHHHIW